MYPVPIFRDIISVSFDNQVMATLVFTQDFRPNEPLADNPVEKTLARRRQYCSSFMNRT